MTEESPGSHLTPCSIVDAFLGPMITGMMIEKFLLGTICHKTVIYFRYHFNGDTFFCKFIVTCLVASAVALGILDFLALYRRLVLDYGDCKKFNMQDRTSWTEPSLTAWIAFVAHTFYIFRCWAVTRSPAICISLGIVALSALVCGIIATILCFSLGSVSSLEEVVAPATIWFASTVTCDLGIASVLVLYFWRGGSVLRSTNAVIARLRWTTIETGSLTAICAIINLILFASMPEEGYGRQDLHHILDEGSGTLISDFQSSFFAAGVLSTTSLDDHFNGEGIRLRNKTSNIAVHDDHRSKPE